jgi:hypothetical protein
VNDDPPVPKHTDSIPQKGQKKAKATSKQGIHHVLLNFITDARPIATITAQKKSGTTHIQHTLSNPICDF